MNEAIMVTSPNVTQHSLSDKPYQLSISLPLPSPIHASILHDVLQVDKELKPDQLIKCIHLAQPTLLTITLKSASLRQLRISTNAIMEQLMLITETIDQCQPHLLIS
ncbi:hypothetical protein HMI54_015664 [Coelomomyces lativittatus]|nr:hypothetical protein HMI56_001782 [Coelomomyces lativittatus]KAJ1509616.1 hypothetical protein HMI55_007323 [Coelomomyces lativittatus]KAJ1512512.1 hypothetical protein HMI54_015664 [Coelomomyces lativittatus]